MRKVYNPEDYVGKKLWSWTVTGTTDERTTDNRKMVTCLCECGSVRNVNLKNLIAGKSKSCGCERVRIQVESVTKNEVGNVYGKLTVLRRAPVKDPWGARWECVCECGNIAVAVGKHLRNGVTTACLQCTRKMFCGTNKITRDGERYNRLVILKRSDTNVTKSICQCDCGNIVERNTHDVVTGYSKSCGCHLKELYSSLEYSIKASATFQGIDVSEWNGFLTSENIRSRLTKKYAAWRKEVMERDDYTCQCCGFKSGMGITMPLNVHHKYSFYKYPEKRTILENGITLCYNCHSQKVIGSFHSVYGRYDNTPEQLDEYIATYRQEHGLTLDENNIKAGDPDTRHTTQAPI